MKMRRRDLNYNNKTVGGVFGSRELTMNGRGFLSRSPNFVK